MADVSRDNTGARPKWFFFQPMLCFVGLTSFWRFPYLMYRNGGGAFLVPYIFLFVLLTLPAMYTQLKLGAVTNCNVVALFSKYAPFIKGIGIVCLLKLFLTSLYFNVYLAQILYYMYVTVSSTSWPWESCANSWNTEMCTSKSPSENSNDDYSYDNWTEYQHHTSPTVEYYQNHVLRLGNADFPHLNRVLLHILGCTFLVWLLVLAVITWGPRIFGWVLTGISALTMFCFVMTFGYFCNNYGNSIGLVYGYFPDFTRLGQGYVWLDAFMQITYTSSAWMGIYPSIGKYMGNGKIISNISWLPLILTMLIMPNLAAILIYQIVGALAEEKGVGIHDVMSSGPGLIFHLLPDFFSASGVPVFWAALTFTTAFLFGVLSACLVLFIIKEALVDALFEKMKNTVSSKLLFRFLLTGIMCFFSFLLSIPLTTEGGLFWVTLLDFRIESLTFLVLLIFIPAFIIISINVNINVGLKVAIGIWFLIGTFISVIILFCHLITNASYPIQVMDYVFPMYAQYIGWLVAIGPLIIGMSVGFLHALYTACARTGESEYQKFIYFFTGHQHRPVPTSTPWVPMTAAHEAYQSPAGKTDAPHQSEPEKQRLYPAI